MVLILYSIHNTCIIHIYNSTCWLMPKLLTNYISISCVPRWMTHRTPKSIVTHFNSAFEFINSTHQSNITISTWSVNCSINIWWERYMYSIFIISSLLTLAQHSSIITVVTVLCSIIIGTIPNTILSAGTVQIKNMYRMIIMIVVISSKYSSSYN